MEAETKIGFKIIGSPSEGMMGLAFSGSLGDLLKKGPNGIMQMMIQMKEEVAKLPNLGDWKPSFKEEKIFVDTINNLTELLKAGREIATSMRIATILMKNERFQWRDLRALWAVRCMIEAYQELDINKRPAFNGPINAFLKIAHSLFPNAPEKNYLLGLGDIMHSALRAEMWGIWEICTEFVLSNARSWPILYVARFIDLFFCTKVDCKMHSIPERILEGASEFHVGLFNIIVGKINFEFFDYEEKKKDINDYLVPAVITLIQRTDFERREAISQVQTIILQNREHKWATDLLATLIRKGNKRDRAQEAILDFRALQDSITLAKLSPESNALLVENKAKDEAE